MKKEVLKNLAGVMLFYIVIVAGVVLIDARMDSLPDTNTTMSISK